MLTLFSALTVLASAGWVWMSWLCHRSEQRLSPLPAELGPPLVGERLSVIVTACDEAQIIEPALASLLEQQLEGLEIIVVNDRSTDDTGAIIDRMAEDDPRIKTLHIETLPNGWLGKVNAMKHGAEHASGDWLLFTDADVVFLPRILDRALAHAKQEKLDHLTLLPFMECKSIWLDLAICGFAQVLFSFLRLGSDDPKPFGAGAFNLVRRSTFERSTGLSWLKMEVADDTGIAFMIANAGGHTRASTAIDGLRLTWYPSLSAMIRGLEKNAYLLSSQGNPLRFFGVILTMMVANIPWLTIVIHDSPVATASALIALSSFTLITIKMRLRLNLRPWLAPLAPIGLGLVGMCALWSGLQTLRKGGITWRGTFYPLDALIEGQRVKL